MNADPRTLLRNIPKIDRVLIEPAIQSLIPRHGRTTVVTAIRQSTDALRRRLLEGERPPASNGELLPEVIRDVSDRVNRLSRPSLRRAINATGIVLHTGLGRAVLSQAAADAASEAARNHSLLEVDPETGDRGQRLNHIAPILRELVGVEDALAVNNNAAAVFLAIAALSAGKEVIISRGQLVEIGGSFRIPDVIRSAGARLVEVGATNKVRISDYADAITPDTALLLRVHPSNFRIVGFTEEPDLAELVALGRERGIPVLDDLGSGALVDLRQHGLTAEPTVHASVAAGADVITFSGDKLLGGPQAGLVVGSRDLLTRLKRHPLMRVLRLDKVTLAGLEATLRLYRDEERAMREIQTLTALTISSDLLRARAEALQQSLDGVADLECTLELGISQVGGGSLPGEELPTTLVCLRSSSLPARELAHRLRTGEPSIWGRVQKERLILDLRTVRGEELPELADTVRSILIESADGNPEAAAAVEKVP